jgi:CcmD family protein
MTEMHFLFFGFGVVWLGIFSYLVYLSGRIRSVRDELHSLSAQLDAVEPNDKS